MYISYSSYFWIGLWRNLNTGGTELNWRWEDGTGLDWRNWHPNKRTYDSESIIAN